MKKYAFLLLLILPVSMQAQEVFTLKKCLEVAMENNYSLKISRNVQQIANNNVTLTNAGYLPVVTADASGSGTLNNNWQESSAGDKTSTSNVHNQTYNVGANLAWNLFSGFRVTTTYNKLKEFDAVGELNTRLAIENTIALITAEYYNCIRQQLRYHNFENVLTLSRERLRIAQTNYTLGGRSKLEVLQAKVDYNVDSSNLVNQQQVVLASETHLKTLMGSVHSLQTKLTLANSGIDINAMLDYNKLSDEMLNGNTSLLVAMRNTAISELDLKLVHSRSLPYLRLNTGYGYTQNRYSSSSVKVNENLGLNYGLTLGINIFDGFNNSRNIKNARLDIKNSELQYQNIEQQTRANLYEVYNSYQNHLMLLGMEKQNLATAKESYEIAMEKYKLGSLAGIELREAQNSFQDAEERLLLIEYQTKADEIILMQLSGGIMVYM